MNLMTGSTSYTLLQKKYSDFLSPSLLLKIDSKRLESGKDVEIGHLEVDLTSGFEASGCEFTVWDCYDEKKRDFASVTDMLQVGAKVEVEIGYLNKREEVFTGYVDTVTYEFAEEEAPMIRVRCMDAKGILMKNRRLEAFTQKKADAVVKALLSEQPASYYLSGKSIDMTANEEVPLRASMKTDYEIIRELAEKLGFEFFIIQGKAYFQQSEKNKTPIMTLEPGNRIRDFSSSNSGNSLVENIEVRAINDKNGKLIQGAAKMTGKFSKGVSGSRMMRSTTQVFYEAGIESASEAKKRAKARMEAMKSGFGSLEFTCAGIPELVPGRFIKIDQFAEAVNGKYYITGVTHYLDGEAFSTVVRARRSQL